MKTFGRFGFAPPREDRTDPMFAVTAEPHVMDRLKRIFPGARQNTHGQLMISATLDHARDLEWFLDRHPLAPVDGDTIAQLTRLADEFRNNQNAMERILAAGVDDYTFTGAHQPALTPRGYQLTVPAMLRLHGGLLLADPLGLGKTFASALITCDDGALPAAVVAPQHLVNQWAKEELPKYFPWARVHIIRKGTPYKLTEFRKREVEPPHFLLFTYGKVAGWVDHLREDEAARRWGLPGKLQTVIFDEADALRTGPKTASGGSYRYEACEQLAAPAKYVIGCTGTPVHNHGEEMWNVANVLRPGCLGTRDEYTRTWGGKKTENPRALGTHLREQGIMLRRSRKEVGKELGPRPLELEQPVETDETKLKLMLEKGIVALAHNVIAGTREQKFLSSGQLESRMRQATGVAKAPYVAAFTRLLLENEEKIILVGHHHDVYKIWMDELEEFQPVLYTGQQSPTQKSESKNAFVNGDSRLLLLALRSGAGLNGLQQVCSTVVFGEIDWTPPPHKQIIGRVDRDGQTTFPVMAHYMISNGGSDPVMADTLQVKKRISEPMVDPDAEIVQPHPEEAAHRTRKLAEDVLRKHGIPLDQAGPVLPEPEPNGPLISRATLRDRLTGGNR